MRTGALALLLLMTSCEQGDLFNQAKSVPGVGGPQTGARATPIATITIAATGPGGCAANWNGQPVTPEQITERGFTLVRQAVDAVGGAQNITEETLPIFNVEAPADLSFACADTILFSLQRAGMFSVRLKAAGGQAPVLADFPLDMNVPPPPIPMVLGIGAGGQMTWNNEPIDAAGLAAHLIRIGGSTATPDRVEGSPPPGAFELRVTREATFGQVYELLRTIHRYRLRPFLYLPSGEAGASVWVVVGAVVSLPLPHPSVSSVNDSSSTFLFAVAPSRLPNTPMRKPPGWLRYCVVDIGAPNVVNVTPSVDVAVVSVVATSS